MNRASGWTTTATGAPIATRRVADAREKPRCVRRVVAAGPRWTSLLSPRRPFQPPQRLTAAACLSLTVIRRGWRKGCVKGATPEKQLSNGALPARPAQAIDPRDACMRLGTGEANRGASGEGDDVTEASIVAASAAPVEPAPGAAHRARGGRRASPARRCRRFAASTARAHFRRGLLHAVVARPCLRLSRPSADGRPLHPRLDHGFRRLGTRRAGAVARPRRRDAGPDRLDSLALVRLDRDGGAGGPDVDRGAARPRRARCSSRRTRRSSSSGRWGLRRSSNCGEPARRDG